MKLRNKGFILTAVMAGLMLPLAAQTTESAPAPGAAVIHQRKENQQDRIAQGVKSGQLTAAETSHLEGREARINKEIHNDRVANGGKLTTAERRQVHRQQDPYFTRDLPQEAQRPRTITRVKDVASQRLRQGGAFFDVGASVPLVHRTGDSGPIRQLESFHSPEGAIMGD